MRFSRAILLYFLLAISSVKADGFGWYPLLFDYQKFVKDYDLKLKSPLYKLEKENNSELFKGRYSDWEIINYLDEHAEEYGAEYPQSYSGDLLAHQTLMYWAKRLAVHFQGSPASHLLTGRVLISADNVRPCANPNGDLIHGDCRTVVIYSADEIKQMFWQMTQLLEEDGKKSSSSKKPLVGRLVNYDESWKALEKTRIYHVLKEAALKNKGVYFYGHN